jgi:hypothetical protein
MTQLGPLPKDSQSRSQSSRVPFQFQGPVYMVDGRI